MRRLRRFLVYKECDGMGMERYDISSFLGWMYILTPDDSFVKMVRLGKTSSPSFIAISVTSVANREPLHFQRHR